MAKPMASGLAALSQRARSSEQAGDAAADGASRGLSDCGLGTSRQRKPGRGRSIQGVVKSGNMPIPGATVTASNTLSGQKVTTWTNVAGQYSLQVPASGRYVVKAQMAAFATITGETIINATTPAQRVDLEIVLLIPLANALRRSERNPGRVRAGFGGRRARLPEPLGVQRRGRRALGECWTDPTSSLDAPLARRFSQYCNSSVSVSGMPRLPTSKAAWAEF